MLSKYIFRMMVLVAMTTAIYSCTPELVTKTEDVSMPDQFSEDLDTTNVAQMNWKEYFADPYLVALIDTALSNNQELNIMLQEMIISGNEVMARKGEYLPSVGLGAGGGVEKVGHYTRDGAVEANTDIAPGKEFPEPLGEMGVGAYATWEIDIWKKLRNAKKSAYRRYLSSVDGKNFMVTQLIAEIASSYYELLALDNELAIVEQNIEIQSNALEIVKLQKQAARVTELAVRRFEAQVLNTKGLQYGIRQEIIETENKINFLVGRYPQPVERNPETFASFRPKSVQTGIPSQLLQMRPDIREAEMQLAASKLDVKVAKARFYPSLAITAGVGFQAFNPEYFVKSPESLAYSVLGDLTAPLLNRKAIKAQYYNANAQQVQAVYNYEQTILNAYIEVANMVSKIGNLEQRYNLKAEQVEVLNQSVEISNYLFTNTRADYMEVLLTQREALDARFELLETKMQQMHAWINIYQALGGGWNQYRE
ncbi:TolC family protein [Reichenbachiella ulvae]|uniref:TolC family protein n=1 Tax=Reichenbachiella ulvae TaxID=2980104 RepID=A0ABT3CPW4_9BACT|nr:TolC family protein [Reichenbachiella ulvae]MCV9385564.1 TolC family protein [Reichenbachiella ulvae]